MKAGRSIVLTASLAALGHLLLGWILVLPAAAVGGAVRGTSGWKTGLFGVLAAWAALIVWNYAVASGPTAEMTRVVAALAGGLPAPVTVAATLLVGALLGAAGGAFGSALRNIVR